MADNATAAETAAKTWVDSVNGSAGGLFNHWKVSLLSKNYTAAGKTAKPLRVRRFAEGCPASCMKEALEYLISLAPYTGVVFNGQPISGSYRPTHTYWKRDNGEVANGQGRPDCTYTLIQDLVDKDAVDGESADTGLSCTEETSTEWHWDDVSVGDVPSTGDTQGRTYAVTGVSRNEDGTLNWALVTRTAITQIGTEAVTSDNEFETVYAKSYDNLYGAPESFEDQDGTAVTVPGATRPADGTLIERQVSMNPDCTYKVTVVKRVAKGPLDAANTDAKTKFEREESDTVRAASSSLGDAPAASGGVTKAYKSELRQDGKWDTVAQVKTELPVTGAQRSKQKTLRGVTETTVDRNVTDSSVSVTDIGDRVQVEMTPGGLWNRTETHVSTESVGDIGSQCQTTVFEHQHAELRNEATRPEKEATAAGGGKTYQVSSKATEEGTWDVTRTETTEQAQTSAQHFKRKTLRGITETTVDRNVTDSSVSVSKVGDEVRVEMTPGGRWNRTVTTVSKEPVGDIGSQCQTTVFEHQHSKSSNVADRPAEEASSAGSGHTYQKTARQTEEGTWDVTETDITEKPQASAQHSKRKTLRGVTETTVSRNVSDSSVQVSNVGDEVRVEMTPGGLYNRTVVSVSKDPVGNIGEACQRSAVVHTHSTTENVADKPTVEQGTVAVNVEKAVTARMTEEGTWDKETRTTTHVPFGPQQIASTTGSWQSSKTEVFQNVEEAPNRAEGTNVDVDITASRNAVGSFDGKVVTRTYNPHDFTLGTVSGLYKSTIITGFVNKEDPPSTSAGTNEDLSVSAHLNGHGTFDGTVHKYEYSPTGQMTLATVSDDVKTVNIYGYMNATSPITPTAGPGSDVSASASLNGHGTIDGTSRITSYNSRSHTSTSSWATETCTTTTTRHSSSGTSTASMGEASGSPDDSGGYSTTVSEFTSKPIDSGWITWDSTTKQKNGTYYYHHGLRVFKNQSTVPTPPRGTSCSVSASINKFGLFDGSISYDELYNWVAPSDESGGSHTIHATIFAFQPGGRLAQVATADGRMYYGTGNEGSYAADCANAYSGPGLPKLSGRVVWTSYDVNFK